MAEDLSISIVGMLIALLSLAFTFLLGSAIQAMLLRGATWLLRLATRRRGTSTSLKNPPVPDSWNVESSTSSTGMPADRGFDSANPYSVTAAETKWTAPSVETDGISVPSFSRAMVIAMIANGLTFAMIFVLQWLPALLGIGLFNHPAVPGVLQLFSFVTVLKWRLPTGWGGAVIVAFAMFALAVLLVMAVLAPILLLSTLS